MADATPDPTATPQPAATPPPGWRQSPQNASPPPGWVEAPVLRHPPPGWRQSPANISPTPTGKFLTAPAASPPPAPLGNIGALIDKYSGGNLALDRWMRIISGIESAWGRKNPVTSKAGAQGVMQIMPDTARQYGFDPSKLSDPDYNVKVAAAIGKDLLAKAHGDPVQAAIGYNAGPGIDRRHTVRGASERDAGLRRRGRGGAAAHRSGGVRRGEQCVRRGAGAHQGVRGEPGAWVPPATWSRLPLGRSRRSSSRV